MHFLVLSYSLMLIRLCEFAFPASSASFVPSRHEHTAFKSRVRAASVGANSGSARHPQSLRAVFLRRLMGSAAKVIPRSNKNPRIQVAGSIKMLDNRSSFVFAIQFEFPCGVLHLNLLAAAGFSFAPILSLH